MAANNRMFISPPKRTGSLPKWMSWLWRQQAGSARHHRKIDEAGVINPLSRFDVILWFGEENVRNEGLRIPVVQRKPTRLDLHHDSMTAFKCVIGRRKNEPVRQGFV